jgi:hypothetical protein
MQYKALNFIITITFLCFSNANFGQAPNFGAASNFALFTAVGALNNTGASIVTGDVGTNVGIFNAFPTGTLIGQIHAADPVSAQAAIDLNSVYGYLNSITCDSVIGTILGNNQILCPNVYCLGGASVLNGNLLLDGQGNSNSVFIFKINGVLSSGVSSHVVLINGAVMENVYWQINGAVDLGDSSVFRGTIVANGALNLLERASLFGKALSISGAINLNHNIVDIGTGIPLPVELVSFKAECVNVNTDITWVTATETNNVFFTLEFSTDAVTWIVIKQMNGAVNSSSTINYIYTDLISHQGVSYYRLKQTDIAGSFTYSNIIEIENCNIVKTKLSVNFYPNPSTGIVHFTINANQEKIISINIYTVFGKQIYTANSNQSNIDFSDFEAGIYYAKFNTNENSMTKKIVIEK